MLETIGIGIATGLAGTGIWTGGVAAYNYRNDRAPLRKLYRPNVKKPVWVVLSSVKNTDRDEFYKFLTPIDGVLAYSNLSRYYSVMRHPKTIDARFSSEINTDTQLDNIVLIGGYENNKISEAFNGRPGRNFFIEDNKICDTSRSVSFGATLDGQDRVTTDYCLITRMPNPAVSQDDGASSTLVAFEGVRHFGTIGGTRDFNTKMYQTLKRLGADPGQNEIIEIVLKYDVYYIPSSFSIAPAEIVMYVAGGKKIYEKI